MRRGKHRIDDFKSRVKNAFREVFDNPVARPAKKAVLTVVGVMITFAAIAATGDVNIAAIAPGVAAALLTTVAGLFVAIPALFGYNWLMSRIKETVVDMRVFADEFLTRIAEYYGE